MCVCVYVCVCVWCGFVLFLLVCFFVIFILVLRTERTSDAFFWGGVRGGPL